MMPAMAAAYATLKRDQVPRATPALNVLQRVGGSIGAALLIVILQNRIISSLGGGAQDGLSGGALSDAARARIAEPLAEAFAHTFWYALALSAVALIPAAILALEERKTSRREQEGLAFGFGSAHGRLAGSDRLIGRRARGRARCSRRPAG